MMYEVAVMLLFAVCVSGIAGCAEPCRSTAAMLPAASKNYTICEADQRMTTKQVGDAILVTCVCAGE